jgi:DNA-binding MarR family transcriptional regulator
MTPSSSWLDDDQQDLWQALLTIVIALPAVLDRQLQADAGISNFEYGVLARLSMAEEATMRLSDLCHQCNSTAPRLSKAMDRFESRGWVIRRVDPSDGRYSLAILTEDGRRKVAVSAPEHVAQVKRLVFDPLTEAQGKQLKDALQRIADTVRRDFSNGASTAGR